MFLATFFKSEAKQNRLRSVKSIISQEHIVYLKRD